MASAPARPLSPTPSAARTGTGDDRDVSDEVRRLLEAGDVDEARRLAPGTRWERLLTLSKAEPGPPATVEDAARARASFAWLDDSANMMAHRGRWVALRGATVVAASVDHDVVWDTVRDAGLAGEVLFVWVQP